MSFLTLLERIPDMLLPTLQEKNHTLYVAWREVCHFIGSLILLVVSHFALVLTSYNIPLITLVALVLWLIYQEAYRHPKVYGQKAWKGALDAVVWLTPFILYVLFF